MLHTLTESGHMMWTCPCGNEMMAHSSHEAIMHVNGHKEMIALPACDCGKQTFLRAAFTAQELEQVSRVNDDGTPTNASVEAAQRHMHLAEQMRNAGKGPTS